MRSFAPTKSAHRTGAITFAASHHLVRREDGANFGMRADGQFHFSLLRGGRLPIQGAVQQGQHVLNRVAIG